jgi:hypothetical protein
LHVPAVWQESDAAQVTWLPAMHAPDWHVSARSHALPSLHVVPFATLLYCVVLTLGWHVAHALAPSAVPEAMHTPPMEQ